jgi:hypothetical protein
MTKWLTLTPAYGRDYKDEKQVLDHWLKGKDFLISDISCRWNGSYINVEDAKNNEPNTIFKIRFNQLADIVLIGPENNSWNIVREKK